MSEYITTNIKIVTITDEKVRDFNTLAASITTTDLNLKIKITKADLDSKINIMLYSKDLSRSIYFGKLLYVEESLSINDFIFKIENNPIFLIYLFTTHNNLIFFKLEEDIHDFSKKVFNYLFDVIERPDLKEYYKLKYV
jgi:hypothetical protein